jgi:3-phosphoglycerate kinase
MKLGGAFRLIFGSGVEAIGGGDSVSAINQAGVADQITRISTGSGAAWSFWKAKNCLTWKR